MADAQKIHLSEARRLIANQVLRLEGIPSEEAELKKAVIFMKRALEVMDVGIAAASFEINTAKLANCNRMAVVKASEAASSLDKDFELWLRQRRQR